MPLIRIVAVEALEPFRLKLVLSDGQEIERDVTELLVGPIFEKIKRDPKLFSQAQVNAGTVSWPNGADLCPDVLIWGGLPPEDTEQAGSASLDSSTGVFRP